MNISNRLAHSEKEDSRLIRTGIKERKRKSRRKGELLSIGRDSTAFHSYSLHTRDSTELAMPRRKLRADRGSCNA